MVRQHIRPSRCQTMPPEVNTHIPNICMYDKVSIRRWNAEGRAVCMAVPLGLGVAGQQQLALVLSQHQRTSHQLAPASAAILHAIPAAGRWQQHLKRQQMKLQHGWVVIIPSPASQTVPIWPQPCPQSASCACHSSALLTFSNQFLLFAAASLGQWLPARISRVGNGIPYGTPHGGTSTTNTTTRFLKVALYFGYFTPSSR